jgi:hypothetical protein
MKPQKKTSKRPAPKLTGAPPPIFLKSLLVKPLAGLLMLMKSSRQKRKPLARVPTKKIAERIWLELLELAERSIQIRTVNGQLENAAEDLARVATAATSILQDLAASGSKMEIISAAMGKNTWPVNMRLGKKGGKPVLEGIDKTKKYLTSIKLGLSPHRIMKKLQDPEGNPFSKAAELIYGGLLDLRSRASWQGQIPEWRMKLLLLDEPITTSNAGEWWSVAKAWMDEHWVANRDLFSPLIKHLKLDDKNYTPSMVKRRVIDDSLKKAFMALPMALVES